MLESLSIYSPFNRNSQAVGNSSMNPTIDEDGRIRMPGFPGGLSIHAYLPLVHLYAKILEAGRSLDRYRSFLRLIEGPSASPETLQAPLTALTPSRFLPHLYYKREDQTAIRAYKVRGAVVGMAKAMESQQISNFLTVSTGNHALGVLKAAELLRPESVRLVVPENTSPLKLQKIKSAIEGLNAQKVQADLLFRGQSFDEARNWALSQQRPGEVYLDPYNEPWVVAGQGTLGLELLSQIKPLLQQGRYKEVILVAPVGGGGLLTGTATALKMGSIWEAHFRDVNLQFLGLRLENMNALLGDAIRVNEIAPFNQDALAALNIPILKMSDTQMTQGVSFVQKDLSQKVEGASGGTVYPVLSMDAYRPGPEKLVISLISGGNTF